MTTTCLGQQPGGSPVYLCKTESKGEFLLGHIKILPHWRTTGHWNIFTKVRAAHSPPEMLGWTLLETACQSATGPVCWQRFDWGLHLQTVDICIEQNILCLWQSVLGKQLWPRIQVFPETPRCNLAPRKIPSRDLRDSKEAHSNLSRHYYWLWKAPGLSRASVERSLQVCQGNLPTGHKHQDCRWTGTVCNSRIIPTGHWEPISGLPTKICSTCHCHQDTWSTWTSIRHSSHI